MKIKKNNNTNQNLLNRSKYGNKEKNIYNFNNYTMRIIDIAVYAY